MLDFCLLCNELSIHQNSTVSIWLDSHFWIACICESNMTILHSKSIYFDAIGCGVLSNFKFSFFDLEDK